MDSLTLTRRPSPPDSPTITLSLSVVAYHEADGVHYVYSPALDLFGYGHTPAEARASFDTALNEMVRYAIAENTLDALLADYGWQSLATDGQIRYQAPNLRELTRRNPDLLDILDRPEFQKYQQATELAAA